MAERVIGIDLGTTNSCVAVLEGAAPAVIAKRQAVTNAENTAYAVKRVIGRAWSSPAVQTVKQMATYQILEGPHQDIRVKLRDQVFSIPEVSAFILQEMKLIAEEYLGHDV